LKRTLIILAMAVTYVVGISYALKYLPFADTPAWIKPLFTSKLHGVLVWMKIRHTVIVVFVSALMSLLLLRFDKKTALFDALAIGTLSVIYGVIFKWVFYYINDLPSGGPSIFTLVEVTDYLAVGFVLPVFVAVMRKLTWSQPPSNNGEVQDAANDAAPHTP
jgi:hypothetical protein